MKARYLIPLIAFLALVALFGVGLKLDPKHVPSPLVGKPMPQFELPRLDRPGETYSSQAFLGEVVLVNVWASWCVSCRVEHPVLVELARREGIPIIGLNYKEVRGDGALDQLKVGKLSREQELQFARERASNWLQTHGGDPYRVSVMDLDGRVAIDFGVYGVPETFVIDKQGQVRYKHTGPISWQSWQEQLQPLLQQLEAEQG